MGDSILTQAICEVAPEGSESLQWRPRMVGPSRPGFREVLCCHMSVCTVRHWPTCFFLVLESEQRTVSMQFFGADPQSGSEVFARHGHILTSPQVAVKGRCHRPSKNRPWDKGATAPAKEGR